MDSYIYNLQFNPVDNRMKPEQNVEARAGTMRKELMKPLHWEKKTARRCEESAN